MDTNARIKDLMIKKGWTEYKLAKESGLSQSTITNLFKRNTIPSIPTLEIICDCFGITLAQFFANHNFVELTKDQKDLFEKWLYLSPQQKELIMKLIDNMK